MLGVTNFGFFSGILGLVVALVPFSGWGSGVILVKQVAREPEKFPIYWGTSQVMTIGGGSIICIILVIVGAVIYSPTIALQVLLPIAIGDIFGVRFAELSGQAFQAKEQLTKTSAIWILSSLYRLISVVILIVSPIDKNLELWSLLYMASGLLTGFTGWIWVNCKLGRGILSLSGMQGEWKNGFYYCISTSATGAYNDIDKTMLNRMSSSISAGAYSAAYRILDAVFIPMRAIIMTSFPRFFQRGKEGIKYSYHYAIRLIPWMLVISIFAWSGMALLAPILVKILGQEYSLTPQILIWLGPILLFRGVHNLLQNCLTGADFQGLRSVSQVGIAVVNLLLNFWLIPLYGWKGAVLSSLVSDGFLVLIFFFIIYYLRKDKQ